MLNIKSRVTVIGTVNSAFLHTINGKEYHYTFIRNIRLDENILSSKGDNAFMVYWYCQLCYFAFNKCERIIIHLSRVFH